MYLFCLNNFLCIFNISQLILEAILRLLVIVMYLYNVRHVITSRELSIIQTIPSLYIQEIAYSQASKAYFYNNSFS